MKTLLGLPVCLLAILPFAQPAAATTVVELGLREMARSAQRIVRARCLESRSEWIGRELYTLSVFEVASTLKGEATARVTVLVPGGSDAKRVVPIARVYPGAPQLLPDQEAVLFLEPSPVLRDAYQVSGFAQGVFTLTPGPDGPVASRDLGQLRLVGGPRGPGAPTRMPLAELERRILQGLAQ